MNILDDIFSACAQPLGPGFAHEISGELSILTIGGEFGLSQESYIYTAKAAIVKFTPSVPYHWNKFVLHTPNQIDFTMEVVPDLSSSAVGVTFGPVAQVTLLQSASFFSQQRAEYSGIFAFPDGIGGGFQCQLSATIPLLPPGVVVGFTRTAELGMGGLAVTTQPRRIPTG